MDVQDQPAALLATVEEARTLAAQVSPPASLPPVEVHAYSGMEAQHPSVVGLPAPVRTSAFADVPTGHEDNAGPASPLSPTRTPSSRVGGQRRESAPVWGWLEPGSKMLSVVLLRADGVTIGRGREAFDSKRSTIMLASLRTIEPPSPARKR